jgi:outer membrane protein OmpA-like peptidoglycan-associated protein
VAGAIIAAGPDVRIIVGGYGDPEGNPKDNSAVARRRAESVVASLVGKGVAPRLLEATVFETVPGETDYSRRVELLIK